MDSREIRNRFLEYFKEKGHAIVPSSSLLPTDKSVLLTTAGMQQFKLYYTGEKSPYGKNATSCQKCFRTSDIEEVGDERHLTFFEMLGNFSFGGYFKKEAINYAKEFIDSLNIGIDYVTVFEGDENTPKDEESIKIWGELGFLEKKGNLKLCGKEDNFWGPTGEEGPCGPTTEIYAKGIEIWNIVFNQYYSKDKKLTLLEMPGIDTGMGLERLAMVLQNKSNIFETDLFTSIMRAQDKSERIIADHIRSATFLIADGVLPSNVEQGYILRRILRRAIRYGRLLNMPKDFLIDLVSKVIEKYKKIYPELEKNQLNIIEVIKKEEEKFEATLERGLREFEKLESITGEQAFNLYQSYGFPLELTEELANEKGIKVNKDEFKKSFEKHQEISRAGAEAKFGGVGERDNSESIKLHTATHLLHKALRETLGNHVQQMGSDITPQRLRFDFSHTQKMTDEEKKRVEDLVNEQIKNDLEVKREEMPYEQAIESGALAFFREKYPPVVSVYSAGSFSKEICAGPHVKKTSELGHFKILKEESSGAGIRRIRAILEK
jgi:alanyl-tRNA synthetase